MTRIRAAIALGVLAALAVLGTAALAVATPQLSRGLEPPIR